MSPAWYKTRTLDHEMRTNHDLQDKFFCFRFKTLYTYRVFRKKLVMTLRYDYLGQN